jgi:NAD(P)-dependent dehydrogenase (short-subunit alcohol dehydrogenase family)
LCSSADYNFENASDGAHLSAVLLACRNRERGESLAIQIRKIQAEAGHVQAAEVVLLDLSSLESIAACADQIISKNEPLHILVNNGGIYDMSGGIH